jgi:very-short-patch-repair endonuclease
MPIEQRLRVHPTIKLRSRELRHPLTPAEQKLWGVLRNRRLASYKFRRQHPIGRFIVDFYCAQIRLVIEVDGGVHLAQYEYDTARTKWLESQGYTVIRFLNTDVTRNLVVVEEKILEACRELETAQHGSS